MLSAATSTVRESIDFASFRAWSSLGPPLMSLRIAYVTRYVPNHVLQDVVEFVGKAERDRLIQQVKMNYAGN